MLALYVNDGLVFSKSDSLLLKFLNEFSKVFQIKISKQNYFVGLIGTRMEVRLKSIRRPTSKGWWKSSGWSTREDQQFRPIRTFDCQRKRARMLNGK